MAQNFYGRQAAPTGLGSPVVYAGAALLCVFLESVAGFDLFFQGPFFREGAWLISKAFHREWKLLVYTGPKLAIGIIGAAFLLLFLASTFLKKKVALPDEWRKPALLVAAGLALIPLFIAILKAGTGIYSPAQLLAYGGKFEHVGLVKQMWLYGHTAGGRSFPAGHASGGFALMALYYLPLNRPGRKALFWVGFCAGCLMGLYQMARGEHFMSHTLVTMFIALALITLAAKKLGLQP